MTTQFAFGLFVHIVLIKYGFVTANKRGSSVLIETIKGLAVAYAISGIVIVAGTAMAWGTSGTTRQRTEVLAAKGVLAIPLALFGQK